MNRYHIVTVEYNSDGTISLFGRNEKGKKEIRVTDFYPYFYVPSDEVIFDERIKETDNNGYLSIDGRILKKITTYKPTDVRELRKEFSKAYEADIPFVRRFLIDSGITSGFEAPYELCKFEEIKPVDYYVKPVIVYIDIEVETEGRFPKVDENEIECLTIGFKGKYLTINTKGVRLRDKDWLVVSVSDEKELIKYLNNFIEAYKPDIFVGWNVKFDLDYLKGRAKRLGVNLNFRGSLSFNLLEAYAKVRNRVSQRLKDVVVDEGFVEAPRVYSEINSNEELVEYNKNDVMYLVMLDDRYKLTEFHWNLKSYVGLEDLESTFYNSVIIDTLLLREYKDKYVLPSVERRKKEKYQGAEVLIPPVGLFDWVAVFDMSRYYPNIMIAYNLTPEPTNGKGIVPKLAEKLLNKRQEYDDLLKELEPGSDKYKRIKAMRDVIKFLVNSLYGYFGSSKTRLYDKRIASKVTEVGRKGLLFLKDELEKDGIRVLYADTDGLFIQTRNPEELEPTLNELVKEFCEKEGIPKNLRIKFEKLYRRILFKPVKGGERGAAKRYAGWVIREGRKDADYLDIKGFEYIRRDASNATRKIQRLVFDCVLRGNKDKLIRELKKFLKEFRNMSLDDIAIRKTLRKTDYKTESDFVRGVIYSNRLFNTNIVAGDYIRYVYTIRPYDVIAFLDSSQIPKDKIVIDWNKMEEKTIRDKIADILKLVGVSWEEIKGAVSLSEVFG